MSEVTRRAAIHRLTEERRELLALCDQLRPRAISRPGLGGGEWSPKDLIGHLESWEEHALAALGAWSRDEPAPIDRALRTDGLTAVNRSEVERKAKRSVKAAFGAAAETHAALLAAIETMPDRRWNAPATSRGHVSLGRRLGQILVGTRDPFAHDSAHLKDLRSFIDTHGTR